MNLLGPQILQDLVIVHLSGRKVVDSVVVLLALACARLQESVRSGPHARVDLVKVVELILPVCYILVNRVSNLDEFHFDENYCWVIPAEVL